MISLRSILFEDQVAFLVGTSSQTGRLLKRPAVACWKPSWVFMHDLTSSSCDMQTCGETDPFLKALVELNRHYSFSVLASFLPFSRIVFKNCWFSHDVTKLQTAELLILLKCYFHDE